MDRGIRFSINNICAITTLAIALSGAGFAGCSASRPPPPSQVSRPVPPPLNLCAVTRQAPAQISSMPGYLEYFVTVSGRTGPILDLKQDDFAVYRGQTPLTLKFFQDDKGSVPVSLVLVMDSSGSMKSKTSVSDKTRLEMTRDAIAAAVSKINRCDELALIGFGGMEGSDAAEVWWNGTKTSTAALFSGTSIDPPRLLQPLTTDHALAMRRLDDLSPWGQTPLYNSVHSALMVLRHAHYPDRAVLLVTDGMDNVSTMTKDEVIEEASGQGVPIYAIGLGDPEASGLIPFTTSPKSVDTGALGDLAAGTGGLNFLVSPLAEDAGSQLAGALGSINEVLGHGYTIGVIETPDAAAPQIKIANHPDAVVHVFRIPEKSAPANPPPGPPKPT